MYWANTLCVAALMIMENSAVNILMFSQLKVLCSNRNKNSVRNKADSIYQPNKKSENVPLPRVLDSTIHEVPRWKKF